MSMRKTILINCDGCNNPFFKAKSEIDRAENRGLKKHFCSNKCQQKYFPTMPEGNPKNLRRGSFYDELSPFRWFALRARTRAKHPGGKKYPAPLVTPKYLKQVWEQQRGICPFTGWTLVLPIGAEGWHQEAAANRASLDRIDCGIGYTEGNVRFVAVMANFARNDFSDQEVIDFCRAVAANHPSV